MICARKYDYVALDSRRCRDQGARLRFSNQNEAIGCARERNGQLFPTENCRGGQGSGGQNCRQKRQKQGSPPKRAARRAGARSLYQHRHPHPRRRRSEAQGWRRPSTRGSWPRWWTPACPLLRGLRGAGKTGSRNANLKKSWANSGFVHRGRQHFSAKRRWRQHPKVFQQAVREHGQGRRTGRCARSRAEAAGGVALKRRKRSRARSRPRCFIPWPS